MAQATVVTSARRHRDSGPPMLDVGAGVVWHSSLGMTDTVQGLIAEYTHRYVAQDIEGVTDLCLVPFLAIREGRPIHMADRGAVHEHFRTVIAAYQTAGFASFSAVDIDIRPLGEEAAFATVRWNALDRSGVVARDTRTTYHLLHTDTGWRFLSYTNHF